MLHRRLGTSGLKVSSIALGGMSFGDPCRGAHPWTLSERESHRLIDRALDVGINFIDTANVYSLGSSEEIIGDYLHRSGKRRDVVLATKVFEKTRDSPLSGGLSRRAILEEIDGSLRRLKTDHVDLYIVHRWDYETPIEETMRALDDLVTSGKVRYLGASSMHTWQFAKAQYTADRYGLTRFVSMQSHYNLINREQEREMIPFCIAEGIGFTPWSPLARGRLARPRAAPTERSRNDRVQGWLYESAVESDRRVIQSVEEIAGARGCGLASIALAWLSRRPGVTAPIVGITDERHLVDAVEATSIALGADEIESLELHYAPHTSPEYA